MENFWVERVFELQKTATDFILITILASYGSTPRKESTKMIITHEKQYGTIGGGKLEWEISKKASQMLEEKTKQKIENYSLGASLGQCCGGKVSILMEGCFFASFSIVVFGAGHISQALVPMLQALDYSIVIIDSRKDFLEKIPANVKKIHSDYPFDEVKDFSSKDFFLIMTHQHQLDFAIAEQVIQKRDFAYLGIVGSEKKSLRFKKLFLNKKYPKKIVEKILCPIGIDLGKTKKPSEIAVSINAQLLQIILAKS